MNDIAERLLMAQAEPGLELPSDAAKLSKCPVHSAGEGVWLVTGHSEIRQVLSSPEFSRAMATDPDDPDANVDTSLLALDPPEHTRVRNVASRAFSARRVASLRPSTQVIADRLIDDLLAGPQPVDLIPAFCLPLPVEVICDLLGIPETNRPDFTRWADDLLSTSPADAELRHKAHRSLTEYMKSLINDKRKKPGDDLLSALVNARDEKNLLTETDLVELAVGILVGGHETTATQLASFTYLLLQNPDLVQRLREQPDLVPAAVEEMLRLVPLGTGIGGSTPRVTTEAVQVGGTKIPAGQVVIGATGLANRDPNLFTEPDMIRLDRETNPHLTFGYGTHHCLGSQLARMELAVALTALVIRVPGLRLAVAREELPWRTDSFVRGLRQLPVMWPDPL